MELSCKRCRKVLLTESQLIVGHGLSNSNICSAIYAIDCPEWLTISEQTEGKLQCPFCSCKLGYWNWAGIQCSCGDWITPGFQFHCSKTDTNKLMLNRSALILIS